jgi:hypothetical protein
MTRKFVRYSPDVEQEEPDFEQTLQEVLDDMKQHMRGSLKTEGIGLVVRNAHAKGYGLARGEFEILSGMPNEYAQGIYAKPGRHEAMVRFSNGTNHAGSDRFLGPIVGIGLKIFGIEVKTLLEDEPDSHTFDYALINHPVFFANTLAHYVFIQSVFADLGLAPPGNLTPEEKLAALHRVLYNFLTGGHAPPGGVGLGGTRRLSASRANQARESPALDVLDDGCGATWRLRRKSPCGAGSIVCRPR